METQDNRNTSVPLPWFKGCCGGRKTRSNSRSNLFLPYLSNGDEFGEKDHRNEFKGSKNGGNEVWISLKWPENTKIRRPKLATAAVFACSIRERPAAVGREILRPRSSGGGAPPCPARVQ